MVCLEQCELIGLIHGLSLNKLHRRHRRRRGFPPFAIELCKLCPKDLFTLVRAIAFYYNILDINPRNQEEICSMERIISRVNSIFKSKEILNDFLSLYPHMLYKDNYEKIIRGLRGSVRGIESKLRKPENMVFPGNECIIKLNLSGIKWHVSTISRSSGRNLPAISKPPCEWIKGLLRLALYKLIFLNLVKRLLSNGSCDVDPWKLIMLISGMIVNGPNSYVFKFKLCRDCEEEVVDLVSLILGSGGLRSSIRIDELPAKGEESSAYYRLSLDAGAKARAFITTGLISGLFKGYGLEQDSFINVFFNELVSSEDLPYALTSLLTLSSNAIDKCECKVFMPLTSRYSEVFSDYLSNADRLIIINNGNEESLKRFTKSYEKLLSLIEKYTDYLIIVSSRCRK